MTGIIDHQARVAGLFGELDVDVDEGSNNGVVFHKNRDCKFGAVYWKYGFSLPENGRMKLSGRTLSFGGIVGTSLSFDLEDVVVEKASRMGGLVHDAFVVTLKNGEPSAVAAIEGEGKFLFSALVKDRKRFFDTMKDRRKVLDKMQSALANKQARREKGGIDANQAKEKKFRLSEDPTLQKMNIVDQRKLKGVNLQDYYEVAWSEGKDCDKGAMYAPFLQQQGKNNVCVGLWETGKFEGEWCGEAYSEERVVTFSFMKQTIGQTLVEVKHTQRCRRITNDRCIVHIKMEMEGFPYADCFVVQVRHVASRVGENDLSIQVGMFVHFLKSCMFERKIRTNSGAETAKAQLILSDMISEKCAPYAKKLARSAEESEDEEEVLDAMSAGAQDALPVSPLKLPEPVFKALQLVIAAFTTIFRAYVRPYLRPKLFDFPPSTVEEALQTARVSMKSLEKVSLNSVSEGQRIDVSREVAFIDKSINKIEKIAAKSDFS